jgi:2-polyprenyl-3-methyl-5-hydroxy-6-metoxy-1,4-benzoquinol methylase
MSQRELLFRRYAETHGDWVDGDGAAFEARLQFFRDLVAANYLSQLPRKDARVLEVGCGKGYFLQVLREHGFARLEGIDLSPANVAACRERFGLKEVHVADAVPFLGGRLGAYDVIFLKDILEHVEKDALSEFVVRLSRALALGGRLIVQVPNMHWIAGLHERYMDLTHEVGFTRESLAQLMRLHFDSVEVRKVKGVFPRSWKQRLLYRRVRPWYLKAYRLHLRLVAEGAEEIWFDCREILAVCSSPAPAVSPSSLDGV